jgi:hypothetical protein
MARKISTQRLTDLCIALNALEGDDVESTRVRKTLYACIMENATILYHQGATLEQLTNAIFDAGWEDQTMICRKGRLSIKIE